MRRMMIAAAACLIGYAAGESPAAGATFKLTSPVGGESWMVATSRTITWEAAGVSGHVLVEIIRHKKDGTTRAFASADAIPVNKGQWTWEVPWEIPTGDTYSAQLTLHDPGKQEVKMQDAGGSFSIINNPAPFIMLRSPAGGESWAVSTAHRISWEMHNLSGDIQINLNKNGHPIMRIATIPAADAHITWTPPTGLAVGSGYTFTVRSPSAKISSMSRSFRMIAGPPALKEWTFIAYIGADNNLEECELDDFLEMAQVGSDANVNVLAEVDRHPAFDTRFGNWTDAKRFHITKGMEPTSKNAVQDIGEINTGDDERLADFLCWAMDHYPAKRYILMFSDHGYGWEPDGREREECKQVDGGIIRDDTDGFIWISTRGLQEALDAASSEIAVVGFDACSMNMIEVAYQLRNTGTRVFIASQNEEDYYGWDYVKLFSALQARPSEITEHEIGTLVVDDFMDKNKKMCPKWPWTHTAIDITAMHSIGDSIKALVSAILADPGDKPSVKMAAADVITATRQAIIQEHHSAYMNGYVFGTNIFFPARKMDNRYTAKELDFVADTTWKAFLSAYLKNDMASTWIGKARKNLWEEEEDGHIDLIAFCRGLVPNSGDIRINVSGSSAALGYTIPQGSSILTKGAQLKLQAVLNDDEKDTSFVQWKVSGDVTVEDPLSADTTLTAHGNGSVTAIFARTKD